MIAIKGMEMPKNCAECNIKTGAYCYAKSNPPYRLEHNIYTRKADDCPLIEIITCKDCKHFYPDEDGRGDHCEKSDTERIPTCADFYCADAERRE